MSADLAGFTTNKQGERRGEFNNVYCQVRMWHCTGWTWPAPREWLTSCSISPLLMWTRHRLPLPARHQTNLYSSTKPRAGWPEHLKMKKKTGLYTYINSGNSLKCLRTVENCWAYHKWDEIIGWRITENSNESQKWQPYAVWNRRQWGSGHRADMVIPTTWFPSQAGDFSTIAERWKVTRMLSWSS